MSTKEKRRIRMEVAMEKDKKVIYYGRLLGIVKDEDFHVLIKNSDSQTKLFTAATLPLSEIGKNYDHLDGKRIVMTVKERDGESVVGKNIFITEKLGMVSYYDTVKDVIWAECEDGEYINVKEEIVRQGEAINE
jgi:hypothetical protein